MDDMKVGGRLSWSRIPGGSEFQAEECGPLCFIFLIYKVEPISSLLQDLKHQIYI